MFHLKHLRDLWKIVALRFIQRQAHWHTQTHTQKHTETHRNTQKHTETHRQAHWHTQTHTHTHTGSHRHAHTHTHTQTCTHTHTHTDMHTHTHTHTHFLHTHIDTHRQAHLYSFLNNGEMISASFSHISCKSMLYGLFQFCLRTKLFYFLQKHVIWTLSVLFKNQTVLFLAKTCYMHSFSSV